MQIHNLLSLNVYTYVHNNPSIYVYLNRHSVDPEPSEESNIGGGVSGSSYTGSRGGNTNGGGNGRSSTSSSQSTKSQSEEKKVSQDVITATADSATNSDALRQEGLAERKFKENSEHVRTFTSTDKYVGETANAIEAKYPGKVIDVNKKVYKEDGTLLTDYDIELNDAVIQVKQGSGKGATRQALNTASSTDKEVIVYLPNQNSNAAVVKGLQKEGFKVFTNEKDLIHYVGRQ